MKATIDVWQHIPLREDESPGFLTYRFAGLIDDKPFCCEVAMEIDGRDCELEHLWGVDIAPEQCFGEEWDALLEAMFAVPALQQDMRDRAEHYSPD